MSTNARTIAKNPTAAPHGTPASRTMVDNTMPLAIGQSSASRVRPSTSEVGRLLAGIVHEIRGPLAKHASKRIAIVQRALDANIAAINGSIRRRGMSGRSSPSRGS